MYEQNKYSSDFKEIIYFSDIIWLIKSILLKTMSLGATEAVAKQRGETSFQVCHARFGVQIRDHRFPEIGEIRL